MSILDIEPAVARTAIPRSPSLGRPQKIGIAFLALWILTSVYFVAPEEQAVVTRFGAVIEPRMMPGIHASLPWPIDKVTKLKVQQLQRLVVGGDIPESLLNRNQPLQSQRITGNANILNMQCKVLYTV